MTKTKILPSFLKQKQLFLLLGKNLFSGDDEKQMEAKRLLENESIDKDSQSQTKIPFSMEKSTRTTDSTSTIAQKYEQIRKSPLYQGQLSYIKEFLIPNGSKLDVETLIERLDVSPDVAKLLLNDSLRG